MYGLTLIYQKMQILFIASALFHKLTTIEISENIKEIFIFADGCPGQNKNITMIGMLATYLEKTEYSAYPSHISCHRTSFYAAKYESLVF